MSKSTVSIAFDQGSLNQFERLLRGRPLAAGAHCQDDDKERFDGDAMMIGTIAIGAHCSPPPPPPPPPVPIPPVPPAPKPY